IGVLRRVETSPAGPRPTCLFRSIFFFNATATTEIYTLSLHDALPISFQLFLAKPSAPDALHGLLVPGFSGTESVLLACGILGARSEEHTSELQSRSDLVCRLLLEKKKRRTP